MEIPNRSAGQRPAAAPLLPVANLFAFGLMGGFVPMATTRISNLTMGFGGVLPSLFNLHFHGFPDATVYGTTSGFPSRFMVVILMGFRRQHADNVSKNLLLLILALLYW
ncbi:hypothetical protein GQ457_05G013070 [Hibiscus cannabinus]